MKYRHQYHAGNFADVHKHVLLLEVLRALTRKDKGLLFVDTHAGRGDYDLHPGDTRTSGRMAGGRGELLAADAAACGARALPRTRGCAARTAAACITRARRCSRRARCAPWIARCSSKRSAKKPDTCARPCRKASARAWKARTASRACARCCRRRSGAAACSSIRPTKSARISRTCIAAVKDALQRFESAVLLLWLPVKLRSDFDAWFATLQAAAVAGRCWLRCCGCTPAIRAPRSTARRWWW